MKKAKILSFDKKARNKLLKGINICAEAVAATLGPKGRNVAIDNEWVVPLVVHDGVTVARSVVLPEQFEGMGVKLLQEAAIKTNDKAGDGTTLSTILAQAIANEGLNNISAGLNPMTLKADIEKAGKRVLEELKKLGKNISKHEEMEQIATISAADPHIGKMVAEALKKTGKDGAVTVEEGSGLETTVDYKEGMEVDRGYLSPYFINNNARVECELENPLILLTDKKINYGYEILPLLEKVRKKTKNLLILCGDAQDEGLQTLVINRIKGVMNLCAIQAPAFGGRRVDELQDIAVLTGGYAILDDSGRELDSVEIEELGKAEKIIADRDKTLIMGGGGSKESIKQRISDLKEQIAIPNTDFDAEIKEQRLAKLTGGVAVINVGGTTDVEMRERKERVIDAVNATKAAVEEGVVAGGEIALLEIAHMDFWDDSFGAQILRKALMQPFKKLIENAGIDYAEVLGKVLRKGYPWGIDVMDGKLKDMIKAGIIDPVKVVRHALENAISVATMVMTTHVLISNEKEE